MIRELTTDGRLESLNSAGSVSFNLFEWLLAWLLLITGPWCGAEAPKVPLPECFTPEQVVWHHALGSHQYSIPLVDRGRVYLGFNDSRLVHPAISPSGGGVVQCLEEATGKPLWQLPFPRYVEGNIAPSHFNHWKCGVCSRPAVDGDRLYVVSPRGDVLCLDRQGQANGNDGPFVEDAQYMGVPSDADYALQPTDGDILWCYNMLQGAGVVPHDVCGSSPLVLGDYVYACTSNGVDAKHDYVVNPEAPSLIVLDKRTGRLVATDGAMVGPRTLHGQWSSPVAVEAGNRTLVLFGAGDGVLYAYEPWGNDGSQEEPARLKLAWKHDCCPADYRMKDGEPVPYARWNKKRPDGPSEIIATPVARGGRVYVAIGQSPLHGSGQGMLSCLDAATGQVIWENRSVDRSLSSVALHEDLAFIADYSGDLHCLDASTGESLWVQALGKGVWSASPVVVNGRLYIGTEGNHFWVLQAAREKQVLAQTRVRSMPITPAFCDGVFYLATQTDLVALRLN